MFPIRQQRKTDSKSKQTESDFSKIIILTMSSACPQAAKSLFAESKRRLSDRVAVNVNNCASIARQIVRGRKIIVLRTFVRFSYIPHLTNI